MWADEGRDAATLSRFFDELGTDRAAQLQAISIDMSAAYLKAIRDHDDVDAIVCIDPFHISQLAQGQGGASPLPIAVAVGLHSPLVGSLVRLGAPVNP